MFAALMVLAVLVPVAWLTFFTSAVMPFVTAIVTRWEASPRVKALTNLVLSAVAGVVGALVLSATTDSIELDVKLVLLNIVVAVVTSQTLWSIFWKPTELAQKAAIATADFGIGKPAEYPAEG